MDDNRDLGVLCLLLSDLHIGKKDRDYSLDIGLERLRRYPEKLAAHPACPSAVRRVYLLLLGDCLDGSGIFPHQDAVNGVSTVQQLDYAVDGGYSVVSGVLAMYPDASVYAVCIGGNHGRFSHGAHPESNLDLIFYRMLAKEFAGNPRVSFEISDGSFAFVSVAGLKGVLTHKGVPHIATPARGKRFLAWMLYHQAHWLAVAHMHHVRFETDCHRWFLGNGSLVGTDSYAEDLALFSPPQQMFFSIREDVGIYGVNWLTW